MRSPTISGVMRVSVATGGRLHIGFTNMSDGFGRCYGSMGVALDSPRTTVVIENHDTLEVEGANAEQIRAYVVRFCELYSVEPRVTIQIRERIPEHVGLGSGTQLALAIGMGLARVCGVRAQVHDLASALGRGRRSGVGIAAFETGGFVVDAGRKKGDHGLRKTPTVVFRRDFPSRWCFVVAVPGVRHGLNGPDEEGVFRALAPPARISEEICRLTLLKLMPALIEQDIEEFGCALTAIDRKTGQYFAEVQGGIYGQGEASEIIDVMLQAGAHGAGQSSWGPSVYGLVDEVRAIRVEKEVRRALDERRDGGSVFIAHGRNRGAKVEIEREGS